MKLEMLNRVKSFNETDDKLSLAQNNGNVRQKKRTEKKRLLVCFIECFMCVKANLVDIWGGKEMR